MREQDVKPGMLVRTNMAVKLWKPTDNELLAEMLVLKSSVLLGREPDSYGVVLLPVPNADHGAWFVQHVLNGVGTISAYSFWEFDPADVNDLSSVDQAIVYVVQREVLAEVKSETEQQE